MHPQPHPFLAAIIITSSLSRLSGSRATANASIGKIPWQKMQLKFFLRFLDDLPLKPRTRIKQPLSESIRFEPENGRRCPRGHPLNQAQHRGSPELFG
jgi:hypothetical protein